MIRRERLIRPAICRMQSKPLRRALSADDIYARDAMAMGSSPREGHYLTRPIAVLLFAEFVECTGAGAHRHDRLQVVSVEQRILCCTDTAHVFRLLVVAERSPFRTDVDHPGQGQQRQDHWVRPSVLPIADDQTALRTDHIACTIVLDERSVWMKPASQLFDVAKRKRRRSADAIDHRLPCHCEKE